MSWCPSPRVRGACSQAQTARRRLCRRGSQAAATPAELCHGLEMPSCTQRPPPPPGRGDHTGASALRVAQSPHPSDPDACRRGPVPLWGSLHLPEPLLSISPGPRRCSSGRWGLGWGLLLLLRPSLDLEFSRLVLLPLDSLGNVHDLAPGLYRVLDVALAPS